MLEIKYGFMDLVLNIHLGGALLGEIDSSLARYSIGEFDGDKLVVTTIRFAPGCLNANGGCSKSSWPHGDQVEITNVFYVDQAGELVCENKVINPVYLVEPFEHLHKAVYVGGEYDPFKCDNLTEE